MLTSIKDKDESAAEDKRRSKPPASQHLEPMMLVMMTKDMGHQTVGVNSDRVRWIEQVAEDRSRIFFGRDESVVVDGAVDQVIIALAPKLAVSA